MPTATFGQTNHLPAGSDAHIGNRIRGYCSAGTISPAFNGTAQSITVRIHSDDSNPHNVKCAIYYASTKAFIAGTEQKVVSAGIYYWETFNFGAPPAITAGTGYLLLVWSNSIQIEVKYRVAAGPSMWRDDNAYDGWPNPTVVTSESANREIIIYCTYEYEIAAGGGLTLTLNPSPKGGTGRPAMLTGGASFGG